MGAGGETRRGARGRRRASNAKLVGISGGSWSALTQTQREGRLTTSTVQPRVCSTHSVKLP